MARPGQDESAAANNTYGKEQKTAFDSSQKDIGEFNTNMDTLKRGGNVGANPWESAGYLGNVNRLQSSALNSADEAGKAEIAANNRRTGGLNTGASIGATKDLTLQKMRLGDQLSAERAVNDTDKNVGYQTNLATMPLQGASAESPFFGGAVSGQSSALKNLTDLGLAQYGPWMAGIQAAGQGAAAAITGGMKPPGCWIAEAIYGVDDSRTHLLRSWLNDEFTRSLLGRAVMALYIKYGERVAANVKKSAVLKAMFRPFFEMALACAMRDRGIDGKVGI